MAAPGGGRKRCVSNPCSSHYEQAGHHQKVVPGLLWLRNKDSNLDRQIQRLQCYPYTIPQCAVPRNRGALFIIPALFDLTSVSGRLFFKSRSLLVSSRFSPVWIAKAQKFLLQFGWVLVYNNYYLSHTI